MQHANFSANFWVGAICLILRYCGSGIGGVVGFAPKPNFELTFVANPAYHLAAHHAAFWAGAVAKVQLILRRCGCGVAGRGMECRYWRVGWVAVFAGWLGCRLLAGLNERFRYLPGNVLQIFRLIKRN